MEHIIHVWNIAMVCGVIATGIGYGVYSWLAI